MSDDPLTFQLLFTIPQHFAFKRNPAGGARLTIDIETETVHDANRMIDLCERSAGVIFAGAVVVVQQGYAGGAKRKAKPKPAEPEWGDDDDTDASGNP